MKSSGPLKCAIAGFLCITNEELSVAVDLWPGSRNGGVVELETYVGRMIVDFCLFCELIP